MREISQIDTLHKKIKNNKRHQGDILSMAKRIRTGDIDLSDLNILIQDWLEGNQALEAGYEVSSVHIGVRAKSVPLIKIRHEDGTQFLPRLRKKPKVTSNTTSSSEKSLGLKRLRLIPGLKKQTVNALGKVGIRTVSALRKMSLDDVLLTKGISKPTAQEIMSALTNFGVNLNWVF